MSIIKQSKTLLQLVLWLVSPRVKRSKYLSYPHRNFRPSWILSAYLLKNILITRPADQGESQHEQVCAPVTQWPQPAVILLPWARRKQSNLQVPGRCYSYSCASRDEEPVPAVSQSPRLTMLPSTDTLALKLSNTVGM
jgi:hypothetical protein